MLALVLALAVLPRAQPVLDETVTVPAADWKAFPIPLRQQPARIDCGFEVESGKLGGIVEACPHRVGCRRIAAQHRQVELAGPPLSDRHRSGCVPDRVHAFVGHVDLPSHSSGATTAATV